MDDRQIIDLYNARDENAIRETSKKYGGLLYKIAYNMLSNHQDSDEIVNETYFQTWNSIPPQKPTYFSAYLCKITRNLSINRGYRKKAKKRNNGMTQLVAEIGQALPDSATVETDMEMNLLIDIINDWLGKLPEESRVLFMRRYWFGEEVKKLAQNFSTSPKKLSSRLYRLRQSLKKVLEKEGYYEG